MPHFQYYRDGVLTYGYIPTKKSSSGKNKKAALPKLKWDNDGLDYSPRAPLCKKYGHGRCYSVSRTGQARLTIKKRACVDELFASDDENHDDDDLANTNSVDGDENSDSSNDIENHVSGIETDHHHDGDDDVAATVDEQATSMTTTTEGDVATVANAVHLVDNDQTEEDVMTDDHIDLTSIDEFPSLAIMTTTVTKLSSELIAQQQTATATAAAAAAAAAATTTTTTTTTNTTAAATGGDADAGGDEQGGSSWLSYFNVFSSATAHVDDINDNDNDDDDADNNNDDDNDDDDDDDDDAATTAVSETVSVVSDSWEVISNVSMRSTMSSSTSSTSSSSTSSSLPSSSFLKALSSSASSSSSSSSFHNFINTDAALRALVCKNMSKKMMMKQMNRKTNKMIVIDTDHDHDNDHDYQFNDVKPMLKHGQRCRGERGNIAQNTPGAGTSGRGAPKKRYWNFDTTCV